MTNPGAALAVFAAWLVLIPVLVRAGLRLGTVILAAAVGLAFALGRGLTGLGEDVLTVGGDRNLLELVAVIVLIYHFSFLLAATRRMEAAAAVLQRTMRDPRLVLGAVPALVGLIPMPGGAMFTAPITDEVGRSLSLPAEDKVFTNYWFRHCWELAFPLYPGIVLCAGVVGISPNALAGTLLPLALTAFAAGGFVVWLRCRRPDGGEPSPAATPNPMAGDIGLGRSGSAGADGGTSTEPTDPTSEAQGHPRAEAAFVPCHHGLPQERPAAVGPSGAQVPAKPRGAPVSPAATAPTSVAGAVAPTVPAAGLWTLWPILLVIGIALLRLPLAPGLCGVIVIYALAERVGWRPFLAHLWASVNGPVLLLVGAVFLFGRVLSSTGLLRLLADHLLGLGLPVAVLSFVLPFLMGALTGVTPGFVGTVFPFLVPFWRDDPVGWLQFAYASGLAGVFFSPAHLCLSMTQEYFQASLRRVWWLLLMPVTAVLLAAALRLLW